MVGQVPVSESGVQAAQNQASEGDTGHYGRAPAPERAKEQKQGEDSQHKDFVAALSQRGPWQVSWHRKASIRRKTMSLGILKR